MDMSNLRHCLTRDEVLTAYALEMIARTSLSQDDFATALSERLYALSPERARLKHVPDFAALFAAGDTASFLRESGKWLRRVGRWLAGDVELPSWVEEAWVAALQGEYQERCVAELAERYGLSGARLQSGDGCPVGAFGQLVARLGQTVELGSTILADGQIGASDLPLLPEFIQRLLATESRCAELRLRAEQALTAGKVVAVAGRRAAR